MRRVSLFKGVLLLVDLSPILVVIGFIGMFAVDVPSYDQWVLPGLFEKVATG
jgi:hypothetical protein